jgi:hypothetical protein
MNHGLQENHVVLRGTVIDLIAYRLEPLLYVSI